MKKTRLILLFCLILSIEAFGCECKDFGSLDSLRQLSLEISDVVFYGELIDYDTIDLTYKFKIHEIFKGNIQDSLIIGKYHDSCSKFPKDKGKWIVYADLRKTGFIDISQCLISRSEKNPICLNCYEIPEPLNPNAELPELNKADNDFFELEKRAKEDWYIELEMLRKEKQ